MSNNLNLDQVAAAQNQKEVTINDQSGQLDGAITELVAIAVDDTNLKTVTATQWTRNLTLQFDDDGTPPDDLVTITVPSTQRGLFTVFNNMTQPLEIEISGQSGASPIVSAGEERVLQSDGVDVKEVPTGPKDLHGALVNITATLSIPDVTETAVAWDAEAYDDKAGRNQFWLGLNATITAAADDNVTLAAHLMETGDGPFQFTTTVTLPAGLVLVTDYWAVKTAAGTFKVATSLANAKAGTVVDITDAGTGTHTIQREFRLIVPDGVTKVRLAGAAEFAVNATGERRVEIRKNSAAVIGGGSQTQPGNANINFMGASSAVLTVVGGDYFTLEVFQNSTAALDLLSANSRTWFSIEEIR